MELSAELGHTTEGPQAFVEFEHPTTRWEALNALITDSKHAQRGIKNRAIT